MKQGLRRLGAVLTALALSLALLPATVIPARAVTADELKTTIESYGTAQGGALTATISGDSSTVTVTGTVTGAAAKLDLDIPADVTVDWKASLTSAAAYGESTSGRLITVSGLGTFEVSAGEIALLGNASGGMGEAIYCTSTPATVKVSGGTVRAVGGYAIRSMGTVMISGGTVSATTGTAVYTNDNNASVTVSGGTVEVTENGDQPFGGAIYATAAESIKIKDGTVRAGAGRTAVVFLPSFSNALLEVTGGTVESKTGTAIDMGESGSYGYGWVVAVNGGVVKSAGSAPTITSGGTVVVSGGTVSATSGAAIHAKNTQLVVSVIGGTVSSADKAIDSGNTNLSVTVNGGTVKGAIDTQETLKNASDAPVYLTIFTGLPANTVVTGITKPFNYGIKDVSADADGKLYFYLPAGAQTVTLTANGKQYNASVEVADSGTNTAVLLPVATGTLKIGTAPYPLSTNHSGTNWSWNAEEGLLTLSNGFTAPKVAIECAETDSVKLVYSGDVSIVNSNADSSLNETALFCSGNLEINGSGGTLTTAVVGTCAQAALYAMESLTIRSGTVSASVSGGSDLGVRMNEGAIVSDGTVSIEDSAAVTAKEEGTGNGVAYFGIYGAESVSIDTTGILNLVTTGDGRPLSAGLFSYGSVRIICGTLTLIAKADHGKYIRGQVTQTGGTVNCYNSTGPDTAYTVSDSLYTETTGAESAFNWGPGLYGVSSKVYLQVPDRKDYTIGWVWGYWGNLPDLIKRNPTDGTATYFFTMPSENIDIKYAWTYEPGLMISGINYTALVSPLTGNGWLWTMDAHAHTYTLTLDSAYTGEPIAIKNPLYPTKLVYTGSVTVTSSDGFNSAISSTGSLNVSGSGGTLTAAYRGSGYLGAIDCGNELTISGGTVVATSTGSAGANASSGLWAKNGVSITGSAGVTAGFTGSGSTFCDGIVTTDGPLVISTSGSVRSTAKGPNSYALSGSSITVADTAVQLFGDTTQGYNVTPTLSGTATVAYNGTAVLPSPVTPVPDSGGSGGGGGASTPAPAVSGSTATTTVTPTVKNGAATASVTSGQVTGALKSAQEAAKASGKKPKVAISLGATPGAASAAATIPQEAVQALVSGGVGGLTVSSGVASVTFDAAALATISSAASGSVTVSASRVDASTLPASAQALVGSRPVFEFSLTSGGKTISQFGGGATLAVPYTLGAGENPNAVIVSYINADDHLETVTSGRYDPASGTVSFTTTHFSQYAVGYNKVAFIDVADSAWYADAVTYLAARGITGGTTATTFGPGAVLNRGQFITLVLKAYGVTAEESGADNFSDAGDAYYTGYLAAAKKLGITNGVGGNRFAPGKAISRQQMFTLLYNALKALDQLPAGSSGKTLSDFTDSDNLAPYAREAVACFVEAGVVSGKSGALLPESATTRAQFAQVLYALLGK